MTNFIEKVRLFTDGGCRGNPGSGAIGIVICDADHKELGRYSQCIGQTTNNRAEYMALIKGLERCAQFTRRRVVCFTDSQLVVNQMSGKWQLKNDELRTLFFEVKKFEQPFDEVIYTHVKRTNPYIKKADKLLNEAFEGR
ncbi:MAG: ribonuclease HI family protein [Anaerolineaceae bacterium]|nr:ribonuclease HI family protein [Anaerolineaceae bacterium]